MEWKKHDQRGLFRFWLGYSIRGLPGVDRRLQRYLVVDHTALIIYFFTMSALLLNAYLNDGVDLLRSSLFYIHWALFFVLGLSLVRVLPRMDRICASAVMKFDHHWLEMKPMRVGADDITASLLEHFSAHSIDVQRTNTLTSLTHYPRHRYLSYEFYFDEFTEVDILFNEDLRMIEKVLFKGTIGEEERNGELMGVILKFFEIGKDFK